MLYHLTIVGHRSVIEIAEWLKEKKYKYDIHGQPNSPFNGRYVLSFDNLEQAMITSLTWGLTQ